MAGRLAARGRSPSGLSWIARGHWIPRVCGARRTRPKLSTVIVRVRPPGALLDGKVFTVDVLGCSDFGEQERITVARRSGNNRHFPAIPLNLIGRNTGTSTSLGLLNA